MKLRMITETVTDQIQALAQKNSISTDEVKSLCQQASKDYWKWVLKQWFEGKISLPDDVERSKQVLSSFKSVLPRVPSDKRDIFKLKSLEEIESMIAPLLGVSSSKKSHSLAGRPGVRLVNINGPYETYEITDEESLGKIGEGTRWCTRGSHPQCAAERYLKNHGKIFTIFQNGRSVIQYTPNYKEIQDIENNPVKDPALLALIPPPDSVNAKYAIFYALNVMKKRWPEGEPYMLQDPKSTVEGMPLGYYLIDYAKRFIGNRWPEAEPIIKQSPNLAVQYARNFMKNGWPEAEPYIMQDPKEAAYYARFILKKRWPEAEPYIMQDPKEAGMYAVMVKKEEWPEAEPYIMKDPVWAKEYAKRILKRRWPEAEPFIRKEAYTAAEYAMSVMKERWPEAEDVIFQDKQQAKEYAEKFGLDWEFEDDDY